MAFSDITGHVKTSKIAVPQIYAWSTLDMPKFKGWTKIGYTEQDVEQRVYQTTHTAGVTPHIEWHGNAVFEGGGTFMDHEFHAYLEKLGVTREQGTEWFGVDGPTGKVHFFDFRANRGILETLPAQEDILRDEQARAVEKTADYKETHERGEFLWNAKPRFGKTLTAYDLCKKLGARTVLIVTNRPAIANSWYDDYAKFLGTESGYYFISETSALVGKPYVVSRQQYLDRMFADKKEGHSRNFIEFVSLQDLKGAIDFGGKYDKLSHIATLEWDVLIIDEAHEGVDTLKTDVAFDHIDRKFTLHLSGTPFKAIANEKFPQEAIFDWTYADEQAAKANWDDPEANNPYADLPRLNLFTYQMSEIIRDELESGIEIDGESEEYAFDLNEFFATNDRGHFIHNADVDRFLDALTTQKKFPFSTPELRAELKHTFWMLSRVASARALAKKLQAHPVFGEYEIVLAAGDGKLDDEEETAKSLDKVRKAIAEHDKTITLSVGQLTTGVTVPEWTGVLMLSNMKSPSLYMQAAFRAQNPCLFEDDGEFLRKENAYVFDFDPARTLTIFEEFANDLYSDTSGGRGDMDARKQRILTLLNFFPVLGEDENGEMIELDAEKVLSIPRKIRSVEVVRRGFMCDFLFQNISNIFRAPSEVRDIIANLPEFKQAEPVPIPIDENTADELSLDENGEVDIPEDIVIGTANDVFGAPIYGEIADELGGIIDSIYETEGTTDEEDAALDELKKQFTSTVAKPLVEAARDHYGDDLKASHKKHVERKIEADTQILVNRKIEDYKIQRAKLELERDRAIGAAQTDEEEDAAIEAFEEQKAAAFGQLKEDLKESRTELIESAGKDIVKTVETAKKEAKKKDVEDNIRDHLRGFSRTIPSFLMAYGDSETTLANFDAIIPDDVFLEVTSITTEQFRFLRDGGDFVNADGETVHFEGHLFDPVVFDDSVREFMRLRSELADYFDEGQKQDIFDYVPPQKTNQIYTPKRVVYQMVDLFEDENPGCFDDPDNTFADLYMKSGLFIAEIVKRLFNSPKMRELFPDDDERLAHIFAKQVFGVAPTEIIYRIATNFVLGFEGEHGTWLDANFVMADTAELAKEGKLAEFVQREFGDKLRIDDGEPSVHYEAVRIEASNPTLTEDASVEAESEVDMVRSPVKTAGGDWILDEIKKAGLEYSDKRSSGGNLWVIGDKSIQATMHALEKRGAKFTYKANGGKATKRRPAWFIPASAAERALKG